MKISSSSRRSKNVVDLRPGACDELKSPQAEAACLEKRISHYEQVSKAKDRSKAALPPITSNKVKGKR